jgi:tRNA A-37 threonylcarbamoyl transferase component Bud32
MADENFGRYEIKGQLGRGGMAAVYYAYDPRFQRDVVIKVLPRELMADEKFRSRFMREAQVSATLNHPAIVPVYDVGEEGGQPFLVMRFMPGGSLEDRIRRGPLSLTEVSRIVSRIAPALDEAHAKGLIHRDIKPSNILFDQRDDAFISDLGIVGLQELASNITGSGPVGTPFYMAPELSMPGGLSHLIDIYALGVTLFQMLTGELPFDAPTPMGVIMAHATRPIPNVKEKQPYLPESIQHVIEKALAKEPYQRYQTAGTMAADLEAVVSGRPLPGVSGAGAATLIEAVPLGGGEGPTLLDQAPLGQAAGATLLDQPPAYDATLMDTAPSTAPSASPTRPAAAVPAGAAEPTRPAARASRSGGERPKKKRAGLDAALGVIVLLIVILLATGGLILTGTLDPLLEGRFGFGGGSPTAAPATQEEEATEAPVVVEEEEATQTPTEESKPAEEEEPSRTPRSTNTPRPTNTAEPTAGPTSAAPTSAPTNTPRRVPTATPEPVECPAGSTPSGGLCLVSYQSNADSFANACARCPDICAGAETVYISCSPGIELSDGKFSAFCSCALP